jgi:hypothetical protein
VTARSPKAFPPLTYGLIGDAQLASDLPVFETIGAAQHDTRPQRQSLCGFRPTRPFAELGYAIDVAFHGFFERHLDELVVCVHEVFQLL